ncbi:MAG TPA: DUF1653 domain-containing protein [Bacteroidales bacterium]|nr:DUF1653 domain-containing protein [Bacteroidales bacterium]
MARLGKYKHFKGGEFEVLANIFLADKKGDFIAGVLYKHLGETPQLYVRPESNFFEDVPADDLTIVPRFVFIEDLPSNGLNAANLMVIHDTIQGSLAIGGPDAPWGFTEKARSTAMQKIDDILTINKIKEFPHD